MEWIYMYPGTSGAHSTQACLCAKESWERASQRLIRSGEWRVPTQAELDEASQGLIGQRICIKGYGLGTVRQFIKSSGWGRHSSHAVDLGAAGGVVAIKLLRKRNGETPWLKSTGRGGTRRGVGESTVVGSHAQNVDAQVRMAQLFMQRGNDGAALEVVLKGLQISPTDPHLLRLKSALQPAAMRPREARGFVDQTVPAYARPTEPSRSGRTPPPASSLPPPYSRFPTSLEAAAAPPLTHSTQPASSLPPPYQFSGHDVRASVPPPAPAPAPAFGMQTGAPPLTSAARKATEVVIEMGFSRKLVERVQIERYDCCEMFYSDPMALASSVLARGEQPNDDPAPESAPAPAPAVFATATHDFAGMADGQLSLRAGDVVKIIAVPTGMDRPWFPDSPDVVEWWKVEHTTEQHGRRVSAGFCPASALVEMTPAAAASVDASRLPSQPALPTRQPSFNLIDFSPRAPASVDVSRLPSEPAFDLIDFSPSAPEPELEPSVAPVAAATGAGDRVEAPVDHARLSASNQQPVDAEVTRQYSGSGGLGTDDWMARRRAKIPPHDLEDEDWDWIAARRAKTSAALAEDSEDDDAGEGLLARTSTTEMRALFSVMDRDNSGKISVENIKDLMCGVGEEITEADLTEMFQHADVTGDGMVSYGEFERVIHLHEAEQQTMRELFDALDVSGTGVLTADDLTTFLEMNGESPEMVSAMITAADTQQDGVVSFEEFVPMVRSQLGAVAPTTGWGHQSEEDALAQLLENSATMANPTLRAHLEARLEACRTHPAGERQEADRTQIGAAAGRDALRLLQTEVEQLRSQLGV